MNMDAYQIHFDGSSQCALPISILFLFIVMQSSATLPMRHRNFWCEIGTSDATSELPQIFSEHFWKQKLAWRQNISGDSETRLLFTEQKEREKVLSYSQFVEHSFNLKLFKHFIKRFSWKRKKIN